MVPRVPFVPNHFGAISPNKVVKTKKNPKKTKRKYCGMNAFINVLTIMHNNLLLFSVAQTEYLKSTTANIIQSM